MCVCAFVHVVLVCVLCVCVEQLCELWFAWNVPSSLEGFSLITAALFAHLVTYSYYQMSLVSRITLVSPVSHDTRNLWRHGGCTILIPEITFMEGK